MTDERYCLYQDNGDRAKTARSANKRVARGGKYVRLPSDNLTRKERNAMNGEVKSYNPQRLMNWKAYRLMPEDLQKIHLQWLADNGGSVPGLIRHFGVSQRTIWKICNHYGVKLHNGNNKAMLDKWDAFLEAQREPQETACELHKVKVVSTPPQEEKAAEATQEARMAMPGALRLCGKAADVLTKAFDLIGDGEYEICVDWQPL